MDGASEAETAASLHTTSDAAPTVNSATFTDPNSVYPHPQSLRSPMGIAPERNSEEDFAIQYVTAKASELRVMSAHGARVMAEYIEENNELIVEFVRVHRLYDNEVFRPSPEAGSGRTTRTLVLDYEPKEGGGGDFSQVPINPFPHLLENQLVQLYSRSVKGDGHCLWRTLSVLWFGTEQYWEHFRLVITSYGQVTNPVLEMHGAQQTYDEHKIQDSNGEFSTPFSYMTNMLAGKDPDAHPSMFELALASKFFSTIFVTLIEYRRHLLPGNTRAIIARPSTVIDQGVIGAIDQRRGDRFPNIDQAYWLINSGAGRNEQGQEVYHWDAVTHRVVNKSREALETTEEVIVETIKASLKKLASASKGDFGQSGPGKSDSGQGSKGLSKGQPPAKGGGPEWMTIKGGRRVPHDASAGHIPQDEFSPMPTPQNPMSKKPAGAVQFDPNAKTQEKRTAPRRTYPPDPSGGKPPVFRSDSHMADWMAAQKKGTTSEQQRTKGFRDTYGREPTPEERRSMIKGPSGLLHTGGPISPIPKHLVDRFNESERKLKGKIGQTPQMRPSTSPESNLYTQAVEASRAWRALNSKGDKKTVDEQRDQIIAETQHRLATELARHTLHGTHGDHDLKLQISDAEIGTKAVELLRERGTNYDHEALGKKAEQLMKEKTNDARARIAAREQQREQTGAGEVDASKAPPRVSQFSKLGGRIRDAQTFSSRMSNIEESPLAPQPSPVSKLDLERDISEHPPLPTYVPGDWGESSSKKSHPLDRFSKRDELIRQRQPSSEGASGSPPGEYKRWVMSNPDDRLAYEETFEKTSVANKTPSAQPSPKDDFGLHRPEKTFGKKKHENDLTPPLIQTNVPGLREPFEWGYKDGPLPLHDGREIQVYEPHLDPTQRCAIDYEDEEEVDLFGDDEDDDSQTADPLGAFEEATKGLLGNAPQRWNNAQEWYIGEVYEEDDWREDWDEEEWRQEGWKGDNDGYRDHGTGVGSAEWWELHPHDQSVARFANVDFGQNRGAWDGYQAFDTSQPFRKQRRDDQSRLGRDGKQGRGLPAEDDADPGSPDGQPPRKPDSPGPGGEDPTPQPGADAQREDKKDGDKGRKPREGGGPPGDPHDSSDDEEPEDDQPDDEQEPDPIPQWRRDMAAATWAELDEKPGTMLELKLKLEGKSFGRPSTPHKITVFEEFKKDHRIELAKSYPNRSKQVDAIFAHAAAQHRKSVALMKVEQNTLFFQGPDLTGAGSIEKSWRIKYMAALMQIIPNWLAKEVMKLAQNNGVWDVRSAISANDDSSLVADDDTVVTAVSNVFSPDEEEQESFEHSVFYCPESVYWLALVSCYNGGGDDRRAIRRAIAPELAKDELPKPIEYHAYDAQFLKWSKLIKRALSMQITIPDPSEIWKVYHHKLLGGNSPKGVLKEYQEIGLDFITFCRDKNTANYKEHDIEKVQRDISEFDLKVKNVMKTAKPENPVKEYEQQKFNALDGGKKKGGKKGDTKGQESKGKAKDSLGKPKDPKGKGSPSLGSAGRGRGQAQTQPAQGRKAWTPKQSTPAPPASPAAPAENANSLLQKFKSEADFEAYYREKADDGYMRGLCSSYVLSWGQECKHGKDDKGRSMCWFKKFGHPDKKKITPEMHAAVTARVQRRQAAKGAKTQGGKGGGGKSPGKQGGGKPPGKGKGKGGKGKAAANPNGRFTDAEMKAWMEAGQPE